MTRADLLERLRSRLARPASADEIMRLLRVPRLERRAARRHLRALVSDGALDRVRGHLYALPRRQAAGKRSARARTWLIGRFGRDRLGQACVVPFDRRAGAAVPVARGHAAGASPGDMVIVDLVPPVTGRTPEGRIREVLGPPDRPGVDIAVIAAVYDLPQAHSAEALAEADRLAALPVEVEGRTDFRNRVIVTIDGEQARDFDDAIGIERLDNGHFELAVHIADVSHYVREGSALDREAADRGTSVYFPERALHMLPEALATGVCSLAPGVDRLVQSCVMEVTPQGEVVRREFHDGVIRSAARLTYTAVDAVLAGDEAARAGCAGLVPRLKLMHELSQILGRRRRARGAVDLDLREAEIQLDTAGLVTGVVAVSRNRAHHIVEEFMLLANETVARTLEAAGQPALYRVHEPPDPLKVRAFETFLRSLGLSLEAPEGRPRPLHFQRLLTRVQDTAAARPIGLLMLRALQKARYDAVNLGHFALAAASYTHFTSPIRRYPDLVVHRLLREPRGGHGDVRRGGARAAVLPDIARQVSERERRADDAERELVSWKMVRFMAGRVGEVFDGSVTGVAAFGLFVELDDPAVEGLVHVSALSDDDYECWEERQVLVGRHRGAVYRLGDRIRVRIAGVDLDRRTIDLRAEGSPVGPAERPAGSDPTPRRRQSARRQPEPAGRRRRYAAPRPGRRERARKKGR